jgi:Fe-S-cluster containining protein
MMKYNCQSCGACCRVIGKTIENARKTLENGFEGNQDQADMLAALIAFPYPMTAEGHCSQLVDNKCKVYLKRPDVCNVKKMFKIIYSKNLTWKQFCTKNHRLCEMFRSISK